LEHHFDSFLNCSWFF